MTPYHTSVSKRTLILLSQKERVQIRLPEKQETAFSSRVPPLVLWIIFALLWAQKSNATTTRTAHCYSPLLHTPAEQADPNKEQSSCIFTACSRTRAAENILGPGDEGCREFGICGRTRSLWGEEIKKIIIIIIIIKKSVGSTDYSWNSIIMQAGKRASFQVHKPFQD